jgi:diguanylate cyclase (GGDEF)-like protein
LIGLGARIGCEEVLVADEAISPAIHRQIAKLLDRFELGDAETLDTNLSLERGRELCVRICRIRSDKGSLVGMILRGFGDLQKIDECSLLRDRSDPLTGLPDRALLVSQMTERLQGDRVSDRRFAVLFLDLDNFKRVNDEFGHLRGDAVLRAAARRIEGCLRERDFIARYGGDEFVALIDGITLGHEVRPVIDRIQMALNRPIELAEGPLSLTLSAGVAVASGAGGTPEELLAAADRAMYATKRSVAANWPVGR